LQFGEAIRRDWPFSVGVGACPCWLHVQDLLTSGQPGRIIFAVGSPHAPLVAFPERTTEVSPVTKMPGWKTSCALFVICLVAAISAPAQILKTLFSFDGTDGVAPQYMSLVQGTDGNFYGTTTHGGPGGATGSGTIFRMTPEGAQTPLYNFCSEPNCTDGANPYAGLLQATDGSFYGTTYLGGAYSSGTIFKITPAGAFITLYSFCPQGLPCVDGGNPSGSLIQGADGNLYGTSGGDIEGPIKGTVFKLTLDGRLPRCIFFAHNRIAPTAHSPSRGWCNAATEVCMEPLRLAARLERGQSSE
jgi:uncharacterized repeat protein (TIGR03803 family)